MKIRDEKPLEHLRALVVDDEPRDIAGTLQFLKLSGLEYRTAQTLLSAESELRNYDFDFFIVDLRLPRKDGEHPDENAGIKLIQKLQNGDLGDQNKDKHFLVISSQNHSVRRNEIDTRDKCWGIFGKLMHNRIVGEVHRLADSLSANK